MKTYIVQGWIESSNYDLGNPPDATGSVRATNQTEAEEIADKRFQKEIGKCAVIDSVVAPK